MINNLKIEKIIFLALLFLCLLFSSKLLAGEVDESGASDLITLGGLSLVAAPVLVSAGVVSLVANGGEALGELSEEVVDSNSCSSNCVIIETNTGKKSIPFVVREDYAQLNVKVNN